MLLCQHVLPLYSSLLCFDLDDVLLAFDAFDADPLEIHDDHVHV